MFDFAPQRPEPPVVTILRKARDMVSTPDRWVQHASIAGEARCVGSAISQAVYLSERDEGKKTVLNDSAHRAFLWANAIMGSIPQWNDDRERTHADVLAAFDRAIEMGFRLPKERPSQQRGNAHV